jgi:hypothetical protein
MVVLGDSTPTPCVSAVTGTILRSRRVICFQAIENRPKMADLLTLCSTVSTMPIASKKAKPIQMNIFGARSLPRLPGKCRFGSGNAPDPGPAAV